MKSIIAQFLSQIFVAILANSGLILAQNATNSTLNTTTTGGQQQPQQVPGLPAKFLFKCHGVLMCLAWLLFAPYAVIFARFQRDPLKRLLGDQLWFQIHRALNTLTFLCTLVAFICVFSARGGMWVGPTVYMPVEKAFGLHALHSLFGLCAVILAVFQPVSALFRCHPDSTARIVYNIMHATTGYTAWLCATVAITIACTSFSLFASPPAVRVLIIVFLGMLCTLLVLMQLVAYRARKLEIVEWINQRQLFVIAATVCLLFALTIAFLIIFA